MSATIIPIMSFISIYFWECPKKKNLLTKCAKHTQQFVMWQRKKISTCASQHLYWVYDVSVRQQYHVLMCKKKLIYNYY